MKQEAIVKHFENSNEVYYIKIRKTVEEKVISILSNSKMLLKLAFLSLTESMRKDPDRYISLIYHNNISSTADYSGQYYDAALLWTTAAVSITGLHIYAIGGS